MPMYCYTTKDGQTVERSFPMGEAPEKVRVKGKVARRDYTAESKGGMKSSCWPMVADLSCAIDADQVAEARAYDKFAECPTEYVPVEGSPGEFAPKLDNPHHRKRYMEAHALFDRNGGHTAAQRRR
jgi:hypothetical protein